MVTIVYDPRRRLVTLDIEAADGEVLSYLARHAPAGLDEWAVALERVDGEATYRVAVDRRNRWRCSCPAWRYRRGKDAPRSGCKHTEAVEGLRRVQELSRGTT